MVTTPIEHIGKGALFALATSVVMSLAAALIKYTSAHISIEMIVAVQYLLCVLFMLPWLLRKGVRVLATQHIKLHLVRALCGWACFYTYYLAIAHIPLVDAALLRNSAPLCVPILVWFLFQTRISWLRWLAVIVGFVGIGMILKPEANTLSLWHLIGFGSAITLAGSIITTRMLTRTESTQVIIFYYFAISALASLPLAIINWTLPPLETWLPLLAIGASIWITMWLYTQAYLYADATVISPISYTGVIFTGFWGWLFWQQVPDIWSLGGVVLVSAGGIAAVWLGRRDEKQRQAAAQKATT